MTPPLKTRWQILAASLACACAAVALIVGLWTLEPPTRTDLSEYQRTWASGKSVDYSAIPATLRRLLLEGRGI